MTVRRQEEEQEVFDALNKERQGSGNFEPKEDDEETNLQP